jgi:hypothetical protein
MMFHHEDPTEAAKGCLIGLALAAAAWAVLLGLVWVMWL